MIVRIRSLARTSERTPMRSNTLRTLVSIASITLLAACTAGSGQNTAKTTTTRTPTSTPAPTPSPSPTATPLPAGWYTDAEKEEADPEDQHRWVAAWFAGENAMPESVSRRWRPLNAEIVHTPEALLQYSVDLLDQPPPDRTSAFAAGIDVHGVTFDQGQVLLDLDADSPGLYNHGSTGLLIGSEQLTATAAFYFPDAQTLCVAYDGEPTSIEDGGPIFLHDASGCPLPLK